MSYDPYDFGLGGGGYTHQENDFGGEHHTVYGDDGNHVSWDSVEYTDSNGDDQEDIVNFHANDGSDWREDDKEDDDYYWPDTTTYDDNY